jgi:DNA-binding transcriptional LysR family regulator
MITLDDLRFIDALSRTGSLSAAARALNVTLPALSMRLKRLESQLGVRLVVRNSRSMRFTNEGENFVSEAQVLVKRIEALPRTLNIGNNDLIGPLKIVAPFGFGRTYIAPIVAQFSELHPAVLPELHLSDNPWKANEGADVVINIGEMKDSSWVAHLLARNERWVCASPKYLSDRGTPSHPRELLKHSCLTVQENAEDVTLWHFRKKSSAPPRKRSESVRISPILKCNDGEVVRNWAVKGLGCVLRSEWDATPLIKQGRLQRILQGWEFQSANVMALVPEKREISARVDRFVKFLKKQFARRDPWK